MVIAGVFDWAPRRKNEHTSRCSSDLRDAAALMAAYHTSVSAHVRLALVHSRRDEGGILDLALETDEGGGCASLGFHDGSRTSFRLQQSCCSRCGMIISVSYRLFLKWRLLCLQLLTAWKQSCQSFTTQPLTTAVRGGKKKGSRGDDPCLTKRRSVPKRQILWKKIQKTDGIHVRQPGTEPGTRGNLSVYLKFSSSLESEVFPVITVDCNLTGFWLCRILSCKNLGFDWRFTRRYVETSCEKIQSFSSGIRL